MDMERSTERQGKYIKGKLRGDLLFNIYWVPSQHGRRSKRERKVLRLQSYIQWEVSFLVLTHDCQQETRVRDDNRNVT